ncbi:histidine kinase [Micromonospora craterilacus]|uniref:histidine kinase n=1 Tax=Micromonospora craterilacus TaxID=1655439 RepID=A0A2W2F485_9ACTN|nr:sensor histidine kinase [Micromonospora craterilacus]PZG23075.1 histidine kinase [Micromonospora craterilacus]
MAARRQWSIAGQLFALQATVIVLLVAVAAGGAFWLARTDTEQAAREEVLAVAKTVAGSPDVRAALRSADPSAILQPYAEATRVETGTDFVVVMAPDRTRYSHPSPEQIGQKFLGEIEPALAGRAFTTTNVGTLGESVRAVAPIRDGDGRVVGLVSVGLTTRVINRRLEKQVPLLLGAAGPSLAVAGFGAWLLNRRLRRQTRGLGPAQMTRMYEYYDAVLHSVREGLVVLTTDRRVALVNDEGRRLLRLGAEPDLVDRPVAGLDLPPAVTDLLTTGRDAYDEPVLAGDRVLVANQRQARFEGDLVGTVLTLRDQTDLRALTSELDSVRALTDALQAQMHESANRLHTMLTLVELGRTAEAVELATRDLALAQQLTDRVVGAVADPALAALLLGKSAQAAERGVDLVIEPECRLDSSPLPTTDLLTVVGNLVDNALEAVAGTAPPRRVQVFVGVVGGDLVVRVSDSGPGLAADRVADAFRRGWSTKSTGRGLGLALVGQVVDRHGGDTEVGPAEGGGTRFAVRLPIPEEVG